MCFSILVLSISFVFAQGILSNYSAEGSQTLINKEPKIITIQDNGAESPSDEQDDNNEGSSDLPDISNQGNETGSGSTGGLQSGGSLSGTNQTDSTTLGGMDNNQSVQTQTQTTNQNVNQTTNQNVNQTTNQNVNVEMKQRLDLKISEEEGEAPISVEEQTGIESQDKIIVTEHTVLTGPDCRTGDVLAGASNAEDLRILLECQEATGTVMHTKNMDDGDYKFFLKLDPEFEFLLNDKNREETEGFLVVEIVPPDRNIQGVYLPQDGDRVNLWGAWVTDKPKGWHEIHPTWKVVKL